MVAFGAWPLRIAALYKKAVALWVTLRSGNLSGTSSQNYLYYYFIVRLKSLLRGFWHFAGAKSLLIY